MPVRLTAAERAERARRRRRAAEEARRTYAEHMANARELWKIRPAHARKAGYFTELWYRVCDDAFTYAMALNLISVLFTAAQARDFELYCARHGRDRNDVLAEILAEGIKPIQREALKERALARRRLTNEAGDHAGAAS
jgi:hypothetical protein